MNLQSLVAGAFGRPSRRRVILSIAVGLAVSGISVAVLAAAVDLGEVFELLSSASIPLAALGVATLGLSMVARTARWRTLLPPDGAGRTSVAGLTPIVLVGYLGNSVAPLRLGEPLRALLAARRFRLGVPETLGSVALERIIDAGVLAAMMLVASLFVTLPGWLVQAGIVLVVAAVAAIALLYLAGPAARALGRSGTPDGSGGSLARRLWAGLKSNPRGVASATAWSVLVWALDGATFWLCAQALGIDVAWPGAFLVAGAATLASILPSGPAAVGTFEVGGLAAATAIGLGASAGLALVVLAHGLTVLSLIVAGALAWVVLQLTPAEQPPESGYTRTQPRPSSRRSSVVSEQ